MKRLMSAILFLLVITEGHAALAENHGLFRTPPVYTPPRGTVWMDNATYYSSINANPVLVNRYGIEKSRILSSVSKVQLGLADRLSFTASLPFNADMFTQRGRAGEKTGPGDVSLGFRLSFAPRQTVLRGFSLGIRANIPEKFGYGAEPLGFRTFSSGVFGYSVDLAMNLMWPFMNGYFSTSYVSWPREEASPDVFSDDVFYDSGFGYLGIGGHDANGLADVIYHDHITMTAGGVMPVNSWVAALFEMSATGFTEPPMRNSIFRIAPGVRLGSEDGFHLSMGIDFGISGPVPARTIVARINIPSFRPAALVGVTPRSPADINRARSSLVAVPAFQRSARTYQYEADLKNAFHRKLDEVGIVQVVPNDRLDRAYTQRALAPAVDTPEELGVRLGANYIINADITYYNVARTNSFAIPYIIGFPETVYTLTAHASVTDLVSGDTRHIGDITATVNRARGVIFFPTGPSSDLEYLSAPEEVLLERQLIDRWVDRFNTVIMERIDLFGWEPLRTELRGDEDTRG